MGRFCFGETAGESFFFVVFWEILYDGVLHLEE